MADEQNAVIAEMEKGYGEKILFSVSEFKGKKYANIRIYYEDDEGDWKPTKKGLSISMDSYPEFRERLGKLEDYLREQGYLRD
jgi:hypothetical protein